jgi:hypothetical protein
MNQASLLPPRYAEKIPEKHLVRVVNEANEKIGVSALSPIKCNRKIRISFHLLEYRRQARANLTSEAGEALTSHLTERLGWVQVVSGIWIVTLFILCSEDFITMLTLIYS